MTKFRVAVVGAGPAGIYASDILMKNRGELDVSIDLFDRLPTPYGLVRYGVAPDHPRIKGIINALREVIDSGSIRFFGNVNFGTDITLEDMRQNYHAVIFTTGAMQDAKLDIPGIELDGSYGAADFVNWFDAHPDVPNAWPLTAKSAAVIGNGNVALDITRMLVKDPEELLETEIPEHVYQGLKDSTLEEVHMFGRRGPTDVKFTPLELRELGEVTGVDMILDPEDFEYTPEQQEAIATNKQLLVIDRIFRSWLTRENVGNAKRRIVFHFYSTPEEVVGDNGKVVGIRTSRKGEERNFEIQALYRAVGYFGSPLTDIPYDASRGIIANDGGRVLGGGVGEPEFIPDLYASGWIKRGPVGLIGATKSDALETIEHLLATQPELMKREVSDEDAIIQLLKDRGVSYTDSAGWARLDAHEISRGEKVGRPRIKVETRQGMLDVAATEAKQ